MYTKLAYVRKLKNKDKWRVYSEEGKSLGTYNSLSAANNRLNEIHYFKNNIDDNELVNDATDVTDRFFEYQDFPANLDVKIVENSYIKEKLYKLSFFLSSHNLLKESQDILNLASSSLVEEAEALKAELKSKILNLLPDEYFSQIAGWSYETDFRSEAFNIGFDDLERNFAQLMHDGLFALDDLNMDEALEVLWAASGLTPDGHHDFDNNLISLQNYQDKDLNRQADRPGRDEVLEVREEIAKKFSEWVEYREPNFDDLEKLSLKDLVNTVVKNYPDLDRDVDDISSEWDEFLDALPVEEKSSEEALEALELESYVPDEISEYTDTSSPEYHKKEDPVGTSGDLERFEEDLYGKGFAGLGEY
jgi:hypothetical protein